MAEYLAEHPPTHYLVAAYLGLKPGRRRRSMPRPTQDEPSRKIQPDRFARPFETLPPHVQSWLAEMAGKGDPGA